LFALIALYQLNYKGMELIRKNELLTQNNSALLERETALSRAIERAETANEAKARFLGVISHEIRTPLNAIFGYLTLLKSVQNLGEEGAKYFQLMESSGSHLLDILNRVVDYSRDQASGFVLTKTQMDVRALCAQCVDAVYGKLNSAVVKLSVAVDSNCALCHLGDEQRLKQVILNLLSNSAKFTGEGSIELNVDVVETVATAQQLRFRVSDTGVGIDSKFLSYPLVPFSQEDDSLTRKYEGVGLGFSIVRGIVESMQGTFVVTSEKGKGTTVDVTIWLELPA
jgi:signal transduction histidine kinase